MDNFEQFRAWTAQDGSLTDAETRTINRALGLNEKGEPVKDLKPDYEMAAQLMAAPRERWLAAGNGPEARDITRAEGGGKGSSEHDTFANWAQVKQAMSDPRYEKDPAYRKGVEEKIGRSQL
jgi:hypothetical protein